MDRKQELEAELIRIQNEKDEYLVQHREKALRLKAEYFTEVNKEKAQKLRDEADLIEAGGTVPEAQTIGAN